MEIQTAELVLVAPLIVLALAGIAVPLMAGRSRAGRAGISAISLAALAASGILAFATLYAIPGLGFMRDAVESLGTPNPLWDGRVVEAIAYGVYEVDHFTVVFQVVFAIVAGLVVLGSPSYMTQKRQGEYYGLLLLATLGMMVVAGSRDLITLFIGFELASFSTYALAGFFKNAPDSNEAALKYFIIGSLSSALTLFGTSLVYGLFGSVAFDAIAGETAEIFTRVTRSGGSIPPLLVFAWGFLLAGFGFKIALVPFHNWAPDVYDGSPTTVSAFLAAGSKKMGFAALFKLFLVGLLAIKTNWLWVAAVVAVVTMTVGNVAALSQTNLKRMLAYSSIAHAGYMLIALPIATQYAIAGSVFQIFTHAFMKAGAFLVVAAFAAYGVGERIEDWKGAIRRSPVLAISMAVFLLSLAGIPPFAGFTSKFVLFSAAIDAGGWFVWLAIAGILNSAVSLFYYSKVVRVMFVEDEREPASRTPAPRAPAPVAITVAVVVAAVATIAIGLYPTPVIDFAMDAAKAILPTAA